MHKIETFLCDLLNKQVYKFRHFFVSPVCKFIICYFSQQVPRFKITGESPPIKMLRGPMSPLPLWFLLPWVSLDQCNTDDRFFGSRYFQTFTALMPSPIQISHFSLGVDKLKRIMIHRHHLFHAPFISSLLNTILGTCYSHHVAWCILQQIVVWNNSTIVEYLHICALQLPTVSFIKTICTN